MSGNSGHERRAARDTINPVPKTSPNYTEHYQFQRLPNGTRATYDQTRAQHYPGITRRDQVVNAEVSASKARYEEEADNANHYMERYQEEFKAMAGESSIQSLDGREHRRILPTSANAAFATQCHAKARVSHLNEHPYSYNSFVSRRKHEGYARDAVVDAERYRDRHNAHISGAERP